MNEMKRIIAILLAVLSVTIILTACSNNEDTKTQSDKAASAAQAGDNSSATQMNDNAPSGGKALVIYFNYSENIDTTGLDVDTVTSASMRGGSTGKNVENLKVMVDEIKELKNADVFSIRVNEVYPPDFEDMTGIAKDDIANNKQFTFKEELTNLADYDTVYFGAPVWWGELPQPVHVFFQKYDFSGKTIIPFGIHHGSAFGQMVDQMKEYEPNADILDGFTIDADTDNDKVKTEFDAFLGTVN